MENFILVIFFIWGMCALLGLAALGVEIHNKYFSKTTNFYWSAYEM